MMRKLDIHEGAVFLVPLEDGAFGVGVLVRADGKGRAYGEFFGPRVGGSNDVRLERLRPQGSALSCLFGDHALFTGRWPVIGRINDWDRVRWSLPEFVRPHGDGKHCFVTEYNDKLRAISERRIDLDEAKGLPEDAQFGSAVVEKKLGELVPLTRPG